MSAVCLAVGVDAFFAQTATCMRCKQLLHYIPGTLTEDGKYRRIKVLCDHAKEFMCVVRVTCPQCMRNQRTTDYYKNHTLAT